MTPLPNPITPGVYKTAGAEQRAAWAKDFMQVMLAGGIKIPAGMTKDDGAAELANMALVFTDALIAALAKEPGK